MSKPTGSSRKLYRIHKGYLFTAVILAIVTFVASLLIFPESWQSIGLLLALAVVVVSGVVNLIANARTAFETESNIGSGVVERVKIEGDSIRFGDVGPGAVVVSGRLASANVNNIYQAPAPLVMSLHQLSPPPADFTGRADELKELVDKIEKGGVTISGLRGMGGIGKTALALKLAEQLTPDYPDAQIYLDLKGTTQPLSASEAMARVIHAYHPDVELPENEYELGGLYRSVLHGQRALLLMDNVADISQVEPLIPPDSCVMLVTSRQHFHLPGLYAKNLDTLAPDEAHELLLKITPRIGNWADEIARLCGYLPLALRITGHTLAEGIDLYPEDYVRRLKDAQKRLGLIEASLSLSYELLNDNLKKLWRKLAVFTDTFYTLAAAVVWGLATPGKDVQIILDEANDRLSELIKYSLVEYNEAASRYHLHDLLHLFASARLSEEEGAAAKRLHAACYQKISASANKLYIAGGEKLGQGLALFDLEWPNIQAGQAWAVANADVDTWGLKLSNRYPAECSDILALRQHPQERIVWLESGLKAAQKLGQRQDEGQHMGCLGSDYLSLGETRRAIELFEQAIAIAREIGDREHEGQHLGNLGLVYGNLSKTRHAIELYEQALVIAREIGDRRREVVWLTNLGASYAVLGKMDQEIKFYQQALAISREIGHRQGEHRILYALGFVFVDFGEERRAIKLQEQAHAIACDIGDRRGEGNALRGLGRAYQALGEHHRAIEFHEQALALAHEIGTRFFEDLILCDLGSAYADLGETHRAIELYKQSLEIARDIGHRRGEGTALGYLGQAYHALGEIQHAIEFHDQALAIMHEIKDRRGECAALLSLGETFESLDERDHAIELYHQSLTTAREINDHKKTRRALINLGDIYRIHDNPRQAIEFYKQALELDRLAGKRRDEWNTVSRLGIAYHLLGETQHAVEFYEQALAIAREINYYEGEGLVLSELGNIYCDLGLFAHAIECCEQALPIVRQFNNHESESRVLDSLGSAHMALNEIQHAIKFYEQALDVAQKAGDSQGEARTLTNLGNAYRLSGEPLRGIQVYEQALAIDREIGKHEDEIIDLNHLGATYASLDELGRAIVFFEQAITIAREIGDHQSEGEALGHIGMAKLQLGEKNESLKFLKSAEAIFLELDLQMPDYLKDALRSAELPG